MQIRQDSMSLGRNPWKAIAERGFGWCEAVPSVCAGEASTEWLGGELFANLVASLPCVLQFWASQGHGQEDG